MKKNKILIIGTWDTYKEDFTKLEKELDKGWVVKFVSQQKYDDGSSIQFSYQYILERDEDEPSNK